MIKPTMASLPVALLLASVVAAGQSRVASYTAQRTDGGAMLTSVTVDGGATERESADRANGNRDGASANEHGPVRIFKSDALIAASIVHFRSTGGVNLAFGQAADQAEPPARADVLDICLSSGAPNPGGSRRPTLLAAATQAESTAAPASGPGDSSSRANRPPGVAVRFTEPVVNRPGVDVVVFELQKGSGGDPFHIAPRATGEELRGITIDQYDIPADDPAAIDLGPLWLYRFEAPPQTAAGFNANALEGHGSGSEGGFRVAAVGIDLSELGYRRGESAEGLLLQSVAGSASFDPVAVVGLPEAVGANLLEAEPEPEPYRPEPGPLLREVLAGPMATNDEIVFAQRVSGNDHWYGNFGHYCETESPYTSRALIKTDEMRYAFGRGGRLCRYNVRTGELRVLLDDPEGGVRDPHLHYDGRRILFSYRPGGETAYHLYEIDVDGTDLRQLTDGPDNDIEPIYTPDGGIVFCSSRCHRYVPCWRTQVATLYRCDADGRNVRMLSNNAEQENTPWMLPDGRVLYMRWEYVDRNQLLYHHLWTVNPDGSGVMVYFGNQHRGLVMLDAKPIPGIGKVVASFSPGHGRAEHMGTITIVDPRNGPDDMSRARAITKRPFRDPYPLSEEHFLVADGRGIHLLGASGQVETVYEPVRSGPRWSCHEPRPLRARPREPVIASRVDTDSPTGRLVLSDVYEGRNMEGVKRGEIKKLLVLEQLPKPANFSGGQEPLSIGGTFTLERIIGTVPVEPDGSAHMELPALRSLFFVALDENNRSVKRMQSFVTVQPGETTSCVGCHEPRVRAPHRRSTLALKALERPPSRPQPIDGMPEVLDFPRDIQPILDRHCVECHRPERREGGVDLCGDRTPMYTTSYWTMFVHGLVVDARNKYGNQPPRALGSSASPLLDYLDGEHHGAAPSDRERATVRLWIESGAPYPGTYAALGSGMFPVKFPDTTIRRRCASCHKATKASYRNVKKGAFYYQFGRREPPQPLLTDVDDIILIRHLAYFQLGESPLYQALCNLDRPKKSLFLLAPLARKAGGLQLCGEPVFAGTADPDYAEILGAIREAAERLAREKRFDMTGFRPNRFYIREMQRYGVLPEDLPADAPVDVYAADRAYWEKFIYRPE
jgi:hypothetical protein